jgi:rubrerythrin
VKKAIKRARVTRIRSRTDNRSQGLAQRRRAQRQPLNLQWFRNFLSQMLAVERGAEKLYQRAIDELDHEELRDRLERLYEQTRRHIELCEQMMEAAGVDIDYQSEEAHLAEQKADSLLGTEAHEERDLNNLENLVLSETKDHWNWDMLSNLTGEINDRALRQAVRKASAEALRHERDHLKWTSDQLARLALQLAHRQEPAPAKEEPREPSEEDSPR